MQLAVQSANAMHSSAVLRSRSCGIEHSTLGYPACSDRDRMLQSQAEGIYGTYLGTITPASKAQRGHRLSPTTKSFKGRGAKGFI